MTDNPLTCEEILGNYGNPDHLKLDNILDPPDPDEEEIHIMRPSHYFAIEKLPIHLQTVGNFNILSLNTQSINAKFDAFVAFLEIAKQQNVHFHAICLQETWLSENSDLSLLQLNGFTCFSQGKQCSSHGGLTTYIDTNINASVINVEITSPIWEGLFVKIQGMENTKDNIIGNKYRPPYDNNYKENINSFTSELDPILSSFDTSTNDLIVTGDFNINLLQVNMSNKEHYGDFLDLMLGHSLFPKITLPTRTAENSCSLIDNIFATLSPNYVSSQAGIIYSRISDHHPYFLSICPSNKISVGMNKKGHVKQRINSETAYNNLKQSLFENDISDAINTDPYCNPNINYDILHDHLTQMKNKYLPYRYVNFNKYRHKGNKWITHGIMKSTKQRDKLYIMKLSCISRSHARYHLLKNKLNTFNKTLKKTIREAKLVYYRREFEYNRSNIKKTWSTINDILCKTKHSHQSVNL